MALNGFSPSWSTNPRNRFSLVASVAGSLGVGKTTCLLGLLQENAGQGRSAVIVNDFGAVGLDALRLGSEAGEEGLHVRNLPGGCLCCSALSRMEETLEAVLKLETVDRIWIEPSGMAIPSNFIPTLRRSCAKLNLDLRPVITLVFPRRAKAMHYEALPFFRAQVDQAAILVANRCDECSESDLQHFREWTAKLDPPKLRVLETTNGKLPSELLELRSQHSARRTENVLHPKAQSGGWVDDAAAPVDAEALRRLLTRWTLEGVDGIRLLRFKGVFPTVSGPLLAEIAQDRVTLTPLPNAPPGERVDLIADGPLDETKLRKKLAIDIPGS